MTETEHKVIFVSCSKDVEAAISLVEEFVTDLSNYQIQSLRYKVEYLFSRINNEIDSRKEYGMWK